MAIPIVTMSPYVNAGIYALEHHASLPARQPPFEPTLGLIMGVTLNDHSQAGLHGPVRLRGAHGLLRARRASLRSPAAKQPGQILSIDDAISLDVLTMQATGIQQQAPTPEDHRQISTVGDAISVDVGVLWNRV